MKKSNVIAVQEAAAFIVQELQPHIHRADYFEAQMAIHPGAYDGYSDGEKAAWDAAVSYALESFAQSSIWDGSGLETAGEEIWVPLLRNRAFDGKVKGLQGGKVSKAELERAKQQRKAVVVDKAEQAKAQRWIDDEVKRTRGRLKTGALRTGKLETGDLGTKPSSSFLTLVRRVSRNYRKAK